MGDELAGEVCRVRWWHFRMASAAAEAKCDSHVHVPVLLTRHVSSLVYLCLITTGVVVYNCLSRRVCRAPEPSTLPVGAGSACVCNAPPRLPGSS